MKDKYDLDLHEVVRLLKEEHGIDNAYLEMTGGNVATIFAGPTRPHPDYPNEPFKEYAAIAGPGSYSSGEGTLYDFHVSVDDQGESEAVMPLRVGATNEADVAKIIAAQARKDFAPLSFDDIEALGFDGTQRSTPPDALWEERRGEVYVSVMNAVNRTLHERGLYGKLASEDMEALRRAAAEQAVKAWEQDVPAPKEEK